MLYKNWMETGIILMNDLLDVTEELINYNTFRKQFSVNTNVLHLEGRFSFDKIILPVLFLSLVF